MRILTSRWGSSSSSRWAGILLAVSALCLAATAAASAPAHHRCSAGRSRTLFYPWVGDIGACAPAAASPPVLLTRRRSSREISSSAASIQTAGLRRKTATQQSLQELEEHRPSKNGEPSLDELRAQLGPLGLLVSNSIELAVVTLGSYISGGALGYLGGSVMGVPSTLLGKGMGGFGERFAALHAKAFASCKSWATLSAAFSGCHNLVRVCRGGVEDGWNAVFGSALTGAFLNRAGGPQAMLQGGATYAGFTYFLEKFFASPSSRQGQQSELLYTDVPLDE
ncbi:hypothetical protein ACHAXT_001913 [Thalassiosira profunda]